jgi:hypothetical protein
MLLSGLFFFKKVPFGSGYNRQWEALVMGSDSAHLRFRQCNRYINCSSTMNDKKLL